MTRGRDLPRLELQQALLVNLIAINLLALGTHFYKHIYEKPRWRDLRGGYYIAHFIFNLAFICTRYTAVYPTPKGSKTRRRMGTYYTFFGLESLVLPFFFLPGVWKRPSKWLELFLFSNSFFASFLTFLISAKLRRLAKLAGEGTDEGTIPRTEPYLDVVKVEVEKVENGGSPERVG